ncbi:sporulation protein YqfD [Pelagirhabdus alkalitolerans]|uniref:sporulation protein YqfD n=1 Tax=Pelagirhabdus alkalitolerans TaxID=1612202 RepID=UPI0015A307FA|nr:sporulation protein YqfD [Pelagirhabdus alkalitolerans]
MTRTLVGIRIKGDQSEKFFELCRRHQVKLFKLKEIANNDYIMYIALEDLKSVRKIRYKTKLKLTFIDKKGFHFFKNSLIKKSSLVVVCVLAFLFFLYLTQAIWLIEIESDQDQLNYHIKQHLKDHGIKEGVLSWWIDSPSTVQSRLLDAFPEILWVGIKQSGITYQLEVIPKQIEKEIEDDKPFNLYAQKDGVIKRAHVRKGRLVVGQHEYVKKGQLLVTGQLNPNAEENDEENEDEVENEKLTWVEVDAEIIAETWYRSTVEVPLSVKQDLETGRVYQKHNVKMYNINIPLWGLNNDPFDDYHIEKKETRWRLGPIKLPVVFSSSRYKETIQHDEERSVEEAVEIGVRQARESLKHQIDPSSSILNEKILHQQVDDGKVKLHIYFTVEEDIVNKVNDRQGD